MIARMRSSLVAAALCLLAVPLWATQPNPSQRQRELIEELMRLTNVEDLSRKTVDMMLAQFQESIEKQMGEPANEADRARREEMKKDLDRYRELIRDTIDYKQVVHDVYMPIFAKYYNEQQLADLIAFYKTPTGQHYLSTIGDLTRDAMAASQEFFIAKVGAISEQVQKEHAKRRPWEGTMNDMRTLAIAVEAWAVDHDEKYPLAGTWEELRKELQPTYIKALPEKDAWGTPYAYVVSPDRDHYRIVSAGADSVFDWDSRRIVVPKKQAEKTDDAPMAKLTDRAEDDIIYADGSWLQIPRAAQHDYQ